MASFVRISALLLADILTLYAIFVMMTYLTNVWGLTITHAAAIVNVFTGVAAIMPIGMAFLVDTFMGDKWMLLLSSIAYSIGMTSLAMSTPPFLSNAAGNCGAYKPECIGDAQKVLFYTALALIAIGISGHITSLGSFLEQQKGDQDDSGKKTPWQVPGICVVMLLPIVGCFALPYIKPWSVRFGIPAICTVVATFLFLSGFFCSSYKHSGTLRPGSPLTTVLRVFVASASKMFSHLPQHDKELNGTLRPGPHTRCLRCLDKAAIIDGEPNKQDRWKHCSEEEVEDTKIFICMIPMWMTFIMCGVVISVGNTFFLEQADKMNHKVGKLKVPLPIFKAFYDLVKDRFKDRYVKVAKKVIQEKYVAPCGITIAMLFSILCCILAAGVEISRLDVIRSHRLLDKPNDKIPMSMFVLLPQYLLLGAIDGISNSSIDQFFTNQAPESMGRYSQIFSHGVLGAGTVGSVLSVYVVSKVSERVGGKSWFQNTLNKSRLDNYYWTLAVLSFINLVLHISVALWYKYKDPPNKAVNKATGNEEFTSSFTPFLNMFSFSKLSFFALIAAASAANAPPRLVTRAEATIGKIGGISTASAQVVLVNVCPDPNFVNCASLNFATIPTGCITVPAAFNNVISSAQALTGIECTFFDAANCTGRSVIVGGNIANFLDVGMNDLTSAVSCVST